MAFEILHSCSLPTAERPVRLAEFDELLSSATSAERGGPTLLTFHFDDRDGLEAQARDLTARESDCCSFFEFSVVKGAGEVRVEVRVPEPHAGILDSLQSRAGQPA